MSSEPPLPAGLCGGCRHARIRRSARSAFLLCGRAAADPAFARYPRLPVLTCAGFEPGEPVGRALPPGAR
jgi:hypothetical protein